MTRQDDAKPMGLLGKEGLFSNRLLGKDGRDPLS